MFAALRPQRLLFSHYGPVADVAETLERSAEETERVGGGDPAGAGRRA